MNLRMADTKIPLLELSDTAEKRDLEISTPRERSFTNFEDTQLDNLKSIVHQHARDGNVAALDEMLTKYPTLINKRDDEDLTAVHYAARYGNYEVVKLLMKRGADPLVASKEGFTPLHFVARYHRREVLTARGDECAVNIAMISGSLKDDPTYKIIQLLVANKADVNAMDIYELTPLHYAAMRSNEIAATALLDNHCAVDPVDNFAMTPLMTACVYGANRLVQLLLDRGANYSLCDIRKNSVLHIAAQHGNLETMDLFLQLNYNYTVPEAIPEQPLNHKLSHNSHKGSLHHLEDAANVVTNILSFSHATIASKMLSHSPSDTTDHNSGYKGFDSSNKVLRMQNSEGHTPLQLAVEGAHSDVVEKMLQLIAGPEGKVDKWIGEEMFLPHSAAAKGYLNILSHLVKYGADIGIADEDLKLPIHYAAESNHRGVVSFLLDQDIGTLEAQDTYGMTPLLLTAPNECIDAAQVLIDQKANLMAAEKNGRSVVFIAAKYNKVKYLQWFLEDLQKRYPTVPRKGKFSLRVNVLEGKCSDLVNRPDMDHSTAMHYAAANGYLEACKILRNFGARIDVLDEDEQTPLHMAADKGHTAAVRLFLEWDRRLVMFKDDNGNTPLHLAARNGHDIACSILIKADADLDSRNVYEEVPVDLAVKGGHIQCLRILVAQGGNVNGDQFTGAPPLHLAAEFGQDKVTEFLLQSGAIIDKRDSKNRTALDVAIHFEKRDVAKVLLAYDGWERLLRTSNPLPFGRHQIEKVTPLRRLIVRFPDVAVQVMDRCIGTNGKDDVPSLFAINYNFEFLDDNYMVASKDGTELNGDMSPFDADGRILKDAMLYSKDLDLIYKNHPLKLMANAERVSLLSHPLVVALLKYKWNHLGRYVYYFALFVYLVFLISYTMFLSQTHAPFNVFDEHQNATVDLSEILETSEATCEGVKVTPSKGHFMFKMFAIVLSVAQLVKECYQLGMRRMAYLSPDNAMEIFIYVSALLTVLDFSQCSKDTGLRLNWQWILAALTAFIAWLNLLLLIRKLPRFGIFVLMFVDVFKTFARFAIIFILFILAFSITFFLMLQNRPEFSSIPLSIVKTTVMTIGEMEFNGIFHGNEEDQKDKLYSHGVAYPVFFFFCIVMTILLMNLLVGLAVDDIKSVQEKAELKRLSMQVDLVLQVERSMPWVRRHITRSTYSFYPNKMTYWKRFRRLFGVNQTNNLSELIQSGYEDEFNAEVKRELTTQRELINNLQTNVDFLYEKQVKVEGMLDAIMRKLEVNYEENDS